MKRLFCAKPLLAAAVALGAIGAASAHAHTDVVFSVGVAAPAYVQPAPVYVQPAPTYLQPAPVYLQPAPVYLNPRGAYYGQTRYVERRGPWGDWDHDGIPNRFDRDSRWYEPRAHHRRGPWGDADHDGVPNRYDRDPRNPYRR